MHQFKINGKMAFEGDVWQWHQDYGTWLNDDMMPTERAMNVAIFLDDVNEFNGPLMFIPGSHKKGVVDAKHDLTTTSYPLWTVDNDLIEQLVDARGGKNGGIVSPKGPAGSMILFHSCLVHASGSNLSPVEPRGGVPEPVRREQPHPPLQAARVHRAPRLHADRMPARRLPAQGLSGGPALEGTACRPAPCSHVGRLIPTKRRRPHEPPRKLQQRAADGKPVRVGLIGAGKFGSMYLAQIPRTPGVHLVGHRRPVARRSARQPRRVGWESGRTTANRSTTLSQAAPTSATTGRRWCATRPST
jgi:hypothetical protein